MEGGRREVGGEMRRGGERWEEEQKLEKDREVVFQTTYEVPDSAASLWNLEI